MPSDGFRACVLRTHPGMTTWRRCSPHERSDMRGQSRMSLRSSGLQHRDSDKQHRSRSMFCPSSGDQRPSRNGGRREGRALAAPAGWCAAVVRNRAHTRSPQVWPERPAFPARWCYGLYVLSPARRACWPPSPVKSLTSLIPASGDQDHTISPSAPMRIALAHRKRPSHPDPYVCGDRAKRPSCGSGRAQDNHKSDF
jgi:hypothetical protein